MKIKSSEFTKSEVDIKKFPIEGLFEIVLIGKSNVGKSSFINSLVNKKLLARTSSAPGKTRTANFYLINEEFYIVDMPGYGYAKVSKSLKEEFDYIIRTYLSKRQTDFIVFFLVDFRHEPTSNDINMLGKIRELDIEPVIILTKSDKVKNSQKSSNLKKIKTAFDLDEESLIFTYSTQNQSEIQKVLSFINEIVYEGKFET